MKWDVDILMQSGIEFLQLVTMREVQDAIADARRIDKERRAVPAEPWVIGIAVEDALLSYPDEKILSIEVRKSIV